MIKSMPPISPAASVPRAGKIAPNSHRLTRRIKIIENQYFSTLAD
jgi:hypothetical protein